MSLSQSSKPASDPLSAILTGLGGRADQPTWLEAANDWSLAFPALDRLKFVAVLRGQCWFSAGGTATRLSVGDVVLIGRTDYVIASGPEAVPVDGTCVPVEGEHRLRLGGDDVLLLGGGVSFAVGTSAFLLDMLPPALVIDHDLSSAAAVATVLSLLAREARTPGLGTDAATVRLGELLVVEAVRFHASEAGNGRGWLAALADQRIGRALRGFHADIAHRWTVAQLAAEAGMSRAAFSARFEHIVGRPPAAYMRAWRLTLAHAQLADGSPVGITAAQVGYTSQSAFGHAYRRTFGVTPAKPTILAKN